MRRMEASLLLVGLGLVVALGTGCKKPKWRGHEPAASTADVGKAPSESPPDAAAQPRDPVRPLHQRTYSIAVDGDLVHAGTTAGVVSWDFSHPEKPEPVATLVLRDSVQHLAKIPESDLLAVSTGPTGIALVDVGSARSKTLTLVNQHPWSKEARDGCHSAWRLLPAKPGVGFVACGGGGVARVNLEDAKNPRVDRRASVDGYVRDLSLLDEAAGIPKAVASDQKVIAAAGVRGVAVVDFAGIAPRILSNLDVGGEARAVEVHGGHAYVAAGAAGLAVVDVNDPRAAVVVGNLLPKTTDMARGIAISGSHALLCLGDSGLVVVDISDPRQPKEVGRFDPKRALNRVTVSGQRLFAANDADGVAILDISKPSEPKQIFPPESK